jgi:uncharacterized protein with PQ loop repeat
MLLSIIGWVGSIVLSFSALPQAIHTFKTKEANSLSTSFLNMWMFGELFTFAYIIAHDLEVEKYQYPLYLNYGLNLIIVAYLIYAKARYKQKLQPME